MDSCAYRLIEDDAQSGCSLPVSGECFSLERLPHSFISVCMGARVHQLMMMFILSGCSLPVSCDYFSFERRMRWHRTVFIPLIPLIVPAPSCGQGFAGPLRSH
ncbi:hypothetical protein B0H17DRAFT_1057252 [Mycena rosella]|uniref:Uncharacterized protein n=1 Tax=Mycena rosella TaxID=1033263 RepID=A0AAD7GLE3_MYCRO|nr:hypothetical protein B0H17DRAFT_1057252 [Mycena rosella]